MSRTNIEKDSGETELCVRCDEEVPVGAKNLNEYVTMTFHQEKGALPMCPECFEEVKGRDMWKRR